MGDVRQLVRPCRKRYAGLDPSLHDSGDTIQWRGKISKRGSPLLRHTLYLAAFVVYRKHEYFHRIYRKHRRQESAATNGTRHPNQHQEQQYGACSMEQEVAQMMAAGF